MAHLPKSLIKKYGISKKAWSVFRSGRSTAHRAVAHRKVHSKRVVSMARRYGRRTRHRSSGFGGGLGSWIMPLIVGGAVAAVVTPYARQANIPIISSASPMVAGAAVAGGGAYLMGKKKQAVKYALGGALLSNTISNLLGGTLKTGVSSAYNLY